MIGFKSRKGVISVGRKKIIWGGIVLLISLMLAGCAGTYSGYGYYDYPYYDYDYGYYGSPYYYGHHREFGEHHEFGEHGGHRESGEHGHR